MTTDTIKGVRIHTYGGPEVVVYEDLPQPELAADDILIRVHAAGVNPIDTEIRKGSHRTFFDPPLPYTLGWEVAGVIERVGEKVRAFHSGEEVFALLSFAGGGFAQYVTVKASQVAAKPTSLDFLRAGAVPLTALTAWQALFDHGRLAAGQRVLIHAASGGVGMFAVQFARKSGAYVLATTSSRNIAYVQGLGANEVIDYTTTRFEDVVHDVDIVLETLGGDVQTRSWQTLRPDGILVSLRLPLSEAEAQAHHVRATFFAAQPDGSQLTEIAKRIDQGEVKIVLEKVFDLSEARQALQLIEAGHVRGKLVLRVEQ